MSNTTTPEALTFHGKILASWVVQGASLAQGSFLRVADIGKKHVEENPEGYIADTLRTGLREQNTQYKDKGYALVGDMVDVFDFSKKNEDTDTKQAEQTTTK
jgi:hypothetical protein